SPASTGGSACASRPEAPSMIPRRSASPSRSGCSGRAPKRSSPPSGPMAEPLVVLLRSPSVREPDPYGAALEGAGFRFAVIPVLRYEATGRVALRAALVQPERYGGLVLTSPRAADALTDVGVPGAWGALPCWAVGEETARRARRLGLDTRGEDAGDAVTLAEYIIADVP